MMARPDRAFALPLEWRVTIELSAGTDAVTLATNPRRVGPVPARELVSRDVSAE
jgi:hypothetical protein